MKKRRPLILDVGRSISDYVAKATSTLGREVFEKRLRDYLSEQNFTVGMNRTTTNTLFEITLHVLKERSAASHIKRARLERDWKAQRKMIIAAEKHISALKRRAETDARVTGKPHTSLLARSLLRRTNDLLRQLEHVAGVQRARSSMLPKLMRSVKTINFYVWELDAYLQHRIPWLKSEKRNLVIAGTMIASGLKSEFGEDYAANIPQARSRANRAMKAEEPFVKWLDQAPLRQTKQIFPLLNLRERKRS
jgi:hypothetical protein